MLKPYEAIADELEAAQRLSNAAEEALAILNPNRGYYVPLTEIDAAYEALRTAVDAYDMAHDTREAVESAKTPIDNR